MESYFYGDLLDLLPVWGVGVSEGVCVCVYNVYLYNYLILYNLYT